MQSTTPETQVQDNPFGAENCVPTDIAAGAAGALTPGSNGDRLGQAPAGPDPVTTGSNSDPPGRRRGLQPIPSLKELIARLPVVVRTADLGSRGEPGRGDYTGIPEPAEPAGEPDDGRDGSEGRPGVGADPSGPDPAGPTGPAGGSGPTTAATSGAEETAATAMGPNRKVADPYRLAQIFLLNRYVSKSCCTLAYWKGQHWAWKGGRYRPKPKEEIEAELTREIQREFDRINVEELERYAKRGDKQADTPPPTSREVTTSLVRNVEQAVRAARLIREEDIRTPPKWIGRPPSPFRAMETIALRDSLVHLPSFARGDIQRADPTPRFFSLTSLDFDFDPSPPPPVKWLKFLDDAWCYDRQSIECLQEWFGYCLTQDTRYQKMLMIIGPPRSGKGTIAGVLSQLVGPDCMIGPTLASLGTNFGLWGWIGKSLAVIADARLRRGFPTNPVLVERLLAISGGDPISIDRKQLSPLTMTLPAKVMVLSNLLPEFSDDSSVIASRFIYLKMTESFLGREDTELLGKLTRELPGIFAWAVEGWKRLVDRRKFLQPVSGMELAKEAVHIASPITQFVAERCYTRKGLGEKMLTSELYSEWTYWCRLNDLVEIGDNIQFGRNLVAAFPWIENRQLRENGNKQRFYTAIRLLNFEELNKAEDYDLGAYMDDMDVGP